MNAIETIRLDLPSEWVEFPRRADEVSAFLRDRTSDGQWDELTPTERRIYQNLMYRMANELAVQKCQLAAIFAEATGETATDGGSNDQRLVAAGAILSRLTGVEMGTPLALSTDVLLAALSIPGGDETVQDLEPPDALTLPVGPCVRTRRLQRVGDDSFEMYVEQYFIPVAPDFEELFLLQFTTPNITIAQNFSELFQAIARTFVMYREGEPAGA